MDKRIGCSILGSGRIALALLALAALSACGGSSDKKYSIGGTATGLSGTLVLQNNGSDSLTITANGAFTFKNKVKSGGAYAVTVATQPAGQTCAVAGGSGTASANVTSVAVTCTTNASHTVGGNVSGLGTGLSVVLRNNGADNLTVNANGAFTFATPVVGGLPYAVTVLTQPTGQTCAVTQGSGTMAAANVTNVAVTCTTNITYTVGGNVSGLGAGLSVVLRNNGGDNLTVGSNGAFTFATPVASGLTYTVTVHTQPTGQTCVVSNGSGTVNASITNVGVTCTSNPPPPAQTYSIGGTVTGLAAGATVVLQNNGGDDLSGRATGAFTFATKLANGAAYSVAVKTQPAGQTLRGHQWQWQRGQRERHECLR